MIFVGALFAFLFFALLNVKLKKRPSSQCTDIISQLPDDILISIIARVPIKQAARMSILSRRWRYLHRSLSNIGFNCVGRYSNKRHYPKIDSVNRFLRLRSGSKIHSFSIASCLNNSVTEGLKQCIHSLGRLGLEQLVLECCCNHADSEFSFSCHLLSELPSLRYCRLSSCTLQPSLRSHCSSLQVLKLTFVTVPSGAMECILSNCPSLQELVIRHCKCPSKLCFRAPRLQLKSLRLGMCSGVEEIELYASNLQVFEFTHSRVVKFIFDHVPRLQTVYLDTYQEDVVCYVAKKLAKDVPNLKSLNLVTRRDKYTGSSRYVGIYMLTNLRRFDLTVFSETNLSLAIVLLNSCPLLQELHLHCHIEPDLYSGEALWEKQAMVYHSELKKMEISGFDGTENVMELALYVLRGATRLEEMRISRCGKIYWITGWGIDGRNPWNEETCKMLHTRLQGQAVSNAAKLIIQHEANIEDPLREGARAREYCDVSFSSI